MEICLLIKVYSKTKTKLVNIMTVNNFFGHWFTDIDIRPHPACDVIATSHFGLI